MIKHSWVATGFYGQNNYGDDLFCIIISRLMREENQDCVIQNGYVLTSDKLYLPIPRFPRSVISSRGLLGKIARVIANIHAARLGRNILFGGGSVFGRHASYRQRLLTIICGALFGARFFAFGVSVGPFASQREIQKYVKLLKKFRFVCVRDKASASILKDHGVRCVLGPDMAWILPSLRSQSLLSSTETAVIAMHSLECLPAMRELEEFFSQFARVVLLALDKGSVAVSDAIEDAYSRGGKVRVERFDYFNSPIELTIDLLSSAQYVVTSKLHGAITAAAYGVNFSLFEYQAKCSEFLREIGFPEEYMNGGNYAEFIRSTVEIHRRGVLVPVLNRSQRVVNRFSEMIMIARAKEN